MQRGHGTSVKNWAAEYPDNDSEKDVFFEADGHKGGLGDRHVQIWWENGVTETGPVTQIVHLTGGVGNYAFILLTVKPRRLESIKSNQVIKLGTFSRAERDLILKLAKDVKFSKTSRVNDCRAWIRDLLEQMAVHELIKEVAFKAICEEIPLPSRVKEEEEEKQEEKKEDDKEENEGH